MSGAEQLAAARRACVSAPAGCGKTYLIAEAVSRHSTGCELILTHTHAGVDALRKKLRGLQAKASGHHIETITGWALGLASAFPKTAGYEAVPDAKDADWEGICRAATQVLRRSPVRQTVAFSYSGVYVDEYQDCTIAQHELIVELSRLVPCRVLGDELQGIFSFKQNVPVQWARDVQGHFETLPELVEPWRWQENKALGVWLLAVRQQILGRVPVDLRSRPSCVHWRKLPASGKDRAFAQKQACNDASARIHGQETLVAILEWAAQCHTLAKNLGPMFSVIEPIDCEELFDGLRRIAATAGADRVEALVDFAALCMTGVRAELQTIIGVVHRGWDGKRTYKYHDQLLALLQVKDVQSLEPVRPALEVIRRLPGVRLYRRELYSELLRALSAFCEGGHERPEDAGWHVRNRTRHIGRILGSRLVSRTLLVKGLEFHHAVVLDADSLDAKHLYVAMTRGSQTLTILSRTQILKPVWNKGHKSA